MSNLPVLPSSVICEMNSFSYRLKIFEKIKIATEFLAIFFILSLLITIFSRNIVIGYVCVIFLGLAIVLKMILCFIRNNLIKAARIFITDTTTWHGNHELTEVIGELQSFLLSEEDASKEESFAFLKIFTTTLIFITALKFGIQGLAAFMLSTVFIPAMNHLFKRTNEK